MTTFTPGRGLLGTFCTIVLIYLLLPVVLIVLLSFSPTRFLDLPFAAASLEWWRGFASSPSWLLSLGNSLIVATAATLLAATLGTMAALGMKRLSRRGANVMRVVFAMPLITPTVVFAVSAFLTYAPLGFAGNYAGLILAHTAIGTPLIVLTVSAVLEGYDEQLTRAAWSLGASRFTTFRQVTFPVIFSGVLSGSFFVFALSLDEVVIASFLAGPEQRTLPLRLFSGIKDGDSPVMAVAATILIVLSLAFTVTMHLLSRKDLRRSGGSKGH